MGQHTSRKPWAVLTAVMLVVSMSLAFACGGSDDDASDGFGAPAGGGFIEAQRGDGDDSAARASSDLASAPPEGGTQGASGGSNAALLLDRKLIRTATMRIETDAVSEKFEEIGNIAVLSGGLVFSSSFGNSGEAQTASITIRIPGERYADALVQLRKLGEVREENSSSTDVTTEYTDLGSQLVNLQATEREYLKLLARSGTIEEILMVQDRLNGVRAQIDQTQGRINLLTNQTDLATITVHLTPALPAKPADDDGATSPLEVAEEAWEASLATLLGFAIVVVAVAAYGWWVVPVVAAGWYVARRMRADRERRQAPPAAM